MVTRVSMVKDPWRRLVTVALWNGAPPQKKTGVASVRIAHCQLLNCSAGIMLMSKTGTDSSVEMIRRCLRSSASASRAASIASCALAGCAPPAPALASLFGASEKAS